MRFRRRKHVPPPAPKRSPLHQTLLQHLYFTLDDYPVNRRWNSQWVMNREWFDEITRIMPLYSPLSSSHIRPIWEPPHTTLFGRPVLIREDGGIPHLEDIDGF